MTKKKKQKNKEKAIFGRKIEFNKKGARPYKRTKEAMLEDFYRYNSYDNEEEVYTDENYDY